MRLLIVGMVIAVAVRGLFAPAAAAAPETPTLSVMTYNVEGLPFPFARGRDRAAGAIAARLKALRAAGEQPHVVVLQEAFGKAQKAIGAAAGYRYIAFGPGRKLRSDETMSDSDRSFRRAARFLKGETLGKWRGSGLAVLSDYPIVSVARAAFPAWACGGSDCMANKGVMMATIAVPGTPAPIAVIATHLNSKNSSGVSLRRSNGAFVMQARTIGRFLAANLSPDTPYVFAGDTNIGKSIERRAVFEAMLAGLPRAAGAGVVRTALATCLDAASDCTLHAADDARFSFARNKDWQVYGAGAATALKPLAISVPFGRGPDGSMLSDHVGYTAVYGLDAPAGAGMGATTIALR